MPLVSLSTALARTTTRYSPKLGFAQKCRVSPQALDWAKKKKMQIEQAKMIREQAPPAPAPLSLLSLAIPARGVGGRLKIPAVFAQWWCCATTVVTTLVAPSNGVLFVALPGITRAFGHPHRQSGHRALGNVRPRATGTVDRDALEHFIFGGTCHKCYGPSVAKKNISRPSPDSGMEDPPPPPPPAPPPLPRFPPPPRPPRPEARCLCPMVPYGPHCPWAVHGHRSVHASIRASVCTYIHIFTYGTHVYTLVCTHACWVWRSDPSDIILVMAY